MRKEFIYNHQIGDQVYINAQGGKCITVIDVYFSITNGLEYFTIDSEGTREYYKEIELTREKIIEL